MEFTLCFPIVPHTLTEEFFYVFLDFCNAYAKMCQLFDTKLMCVRVSPVLVDSLHPSIKLAILLSKDVLKTVPIPQDDLS